MSAFALAAFAKTRSSPATGAVPPQFEATFHTPLVVPVQLRVVAKREVERARETTATAKAFKDHSLLVVGDAAQ